MSNTVNINEAKNIVLKMIQSNTNLPCFLHSSPGLGKSSIIRQIAKQTDMNLVDIRLASIESSDLCGIPYVHGGEQLFSTPTWFPTDPDSKGILFLDELSNAPINVQHAAYRLILDRQIQDDKHLPKGWFIVAAGNLKTDKTGVKSIAPALANRFGVHINIVQNLDAFMKYAVNTGLDKSVVGFLNMSGDKLYQFDPNKSDLAFPTPRSWEFASQLIHCGFDNGELLSALSGCIGEGVAAEFLAFREYYAKLPNFANIMSGKDTYKVDRNDIGLMFALSTSLIFNMLENYKSENKLKNLIKVVDQLPDETLIMIYKTISMSEDIDAMLTITEDNDSYNRIRKYIK